MSTSTEVKTTQFDGFKWFISILLIVAAIYGNHHFADESVLFRAIGIVVAISVALFIAAQTAKGQEALEFARESRMEVRKVVWPSRQEAIQTTLIIAVFVVIIASFLWGVDALLGFGINSLMSL